MRYDDNIFVVVTRIFKGRNARKHSIVWTVTKLSADVIMLSEKQRMNYQSVRDFSPTSVAVDHTDSDSPKQTDPSSNLDSSPELTIPFNNAQLKSFFQKAPIGIHCTGG